MLEPEKLRRRLSERFSSVFLTAEHVVASGESLRRLLEQAAFDVAVEHAQEVPSGPPRSVIMQYEERAEKAELLVESCRNFSGKLEARLQAALLRARKAEAELEAFKQGVENGRS